MKRIAIAAVTIVALLAILVAAIPYVVPGQLLRSLVAGPIAAWTGRTVTVAGEPRLVLYPELSISVGNLTVANPEGMGDEPFVTADGVRASLRVLPLLIGRAEFDEFELIRPRFRLVVAKDGGNNWEMATSAIVKRAKRAAKRAAAADPADADVAAGDASVDLRIGRITITDGIILYDDLASDHREEMTAISLDILWPSAATAMRGSGSLLWRGERVEFNGSIAKPLAAIAGGESPIRLAVASTILRATFAGTANTTEPPQLAGTATVTTASLRRAIDLTGTKVGPGAILGAAAISGEARWIGNAISFEQAAMELDGNRAEGALSVVMGGLRPAIQGTLTTGRLDVTPYIEAARADILADGPWLLAPTKLSFAEAVDADLKISASKVLLGANELDGVSAGIVVRDGAISVEATKGYFHGGEFAARMGAGMVGDELVAGAEAAATGLPLLAALTDLLGIEGLDGTAAADLSLRSRGATWGEFARGVAGTGSIVATTGMLAGIDVNQIAETLADPLAEPITQAAGETAFSRVAATLAIANGAISTDDLTMTGAGYTLRLRGNGSVVTGLVNAEATVDGGRGPLVVAVTGRWRTPVITRSPAPAAAGNQATTHDTPGLLPGG